MMDERLEALLIDRALDGLSPEVCWLLDEYLAEHPGYEVPAEQFRTTVELARRSLATNADRERAMARGFRLLPVRGMRKAAWLLWPAACAACLVLGWRLGTMGTVGDGSDRPLAAAVGDLPGNAAALAPGMPPYRARAASDDGGFWSLSRLAKLREEMARTRRPASVVEWEAPFKPRISG